jgi:hypothetical protein
MNLYQIIGLTKINFDGLSYETDSQKYILKNENKKGMTKTREYTKYILYVLLDNLYYGIHLSEYDCASFSGKLCQIGMMKIINSNYTDIISMITHIPRRPLFIYADLKIKEYDYDDSMYIYLHEEPHTCLFEFSSIGGNESIPSGYVYVNMDLFQLST